MSKHLSTICLLLSLSFFAQTECYAPAHCPAENLKECTNADDNTANPEPRILVEIAAIGIDGFKKGVTLTELEFSENNNNQNVTLTAEQSAALLLAAAKYSKIFPIDCGTSGMRELLDMLGKVLQMKILSNPSLTLENGKRGLVSVGGHDRYNSGYFDISVTPSINSNGSEIIDLNLDVVLTSMQLKSQDTRKLSVSSSLTSNKIMTIGGFLDDNDFDPTKTDFMRDLVVLVSAKIAEPIKP